MLFTKQPPSGKGLRPPAEAHRTISARVERFVATRMLLDESLFWIRLRDILPRKLEIESS